MRFSSIFQFHLTPRPAVVEPAPARVEIAPLRAAVAPRLPGAELPEALDDRVRLVGEWQLGEG
jgi:hypothetical protein